MTSYIKIGRGARRTMGVFRGYWSFVEAQNHGGGVNLLCFVEVKGDIRPHTLPIFDFSELCCEKDQHNLRKIDT